MGRLRKAMPAWSPLSLPPDVLLGWWEARYTNNGYADAGQVDAWPDRSGRSRDLTQATGTKRPSYRRTGLNGLTSLRFDGGDVLFHTSAPFHGLTKGYMAVVFGTTVGNLNKYLVSAPSGGSANGFDLGTDAAGMVAYVKTDTVAATGLLATLSWSDGRPYLAEHFVDLDLAGSERTLVGGDQVVATATIGGASISAAHAEFSVGGFTNTFAAFFTGDIFEVLICSRPLAGREADLYYRHCQKRYGADVRAAP